MGNYNFVDDLTLSSVDSWSKWGLNTDDIAAAQAFRIDNIDSYFWSHTEQFDIPIYDFPNIAPPFENFIMFAEETSAFHAQPDGSRARITDVAPRFRYGVWVVSRPIEKADSREAIDSFSEWGTNRLLLKKSGVKWYTQVALFIQRSRVHEIEHVGLTQVLVDESGKLDSLRFFPRKRLVAELEQTHKLTPDQANTAAQRNMMALLYAPFLAISFLHCKNVTYQDAVLTRPEQRHAKKFESKSGIPAAIWKTINVQPMQRILTTEGDSESAGLMQALHICRGHFKDYRNGRGLFGKIKGLYWWDQHLRGNEAAGVIIKDYNVLPPV